MLLVFWLVLAKTLIGRIIMKKSKLILLLAVLICVFGEPIKQITGIPVVHVGNGIAFCMFGFLMIKGEYKRFFGRNESREMKIFLVGFAAFLLLGSASALVYGVRPLLYLWSMRNYLRFLVIFLDCYLVFDEKDIPLFYRLLDGTIIVHVILTLIQFFFLGVKWDYLNGIYGTMMGGNSGVNCLFLVTTCVCFYRFYKREMKWPIFLLHIFWMCIDAALSEIKVYLVELVAAIVIYVVVTKQWKRMLALMSVIVVIMVASIVLIYWIYPSFDGFYSRMFTRFYEVLGASHHPNLDSLGRLNQISGMTKPMMDYVSSVRPGLEGLAKVIGCGFGSGELSTNGMFDSEFYVTNIRLWYWDFILPLLYLETGLLGVAFYVGAWVVAGVSAFVSFLRKGEGEAFLKVLLCGLTVILIVYDITMRNNYGYIMWVFAGVVVHNSQVSLNFQ